MEIREHLAKPTEQNRRFIDHPELWLVVIERIKWLSLPKTSEVRIPDLSVASVITGKSFLPGSVQNLTFSELYVVLHRATYVSSNLKVTLNVYPPTTGIDSGSWGTLLPLQSGGKEGSFNNYWRGRSHSKGYTSGGTADAWPVWNNYFICGHGMLKNVSATIDFNVFQVMKLIATISANSVVKPTSPHQLHELRPTNHK